MGLSLSPLGTDAASAHKMCSNTYHTHPKVVNHVVKDILWRATVTQAGPNQLKYKWYSQGDYKGYILC